MQKMEQVTKGAVRRALQQVVVAEGWRDIGNFGLHSEIEIESGTVYLAMEVNRAQATAMEPLCRAAEKAVLALPGVVQVKAVLTAHRAPGAQVITDIGPNKEVPVPSRTPNLFVVLKVTQACNMACTYCSAEKDHTKVPLLTGEMGARVIDSLAQLDLGSYSLCFHGGEPLLGFPAIQETVNYARARYPEIDIRFSMQSNLVRMTDAIARWCHERSVSVGFSIDGEAPINDVLRIFHNGKGTTEKTLTGLSILQRYQPRVGCVAVIGSHNWDKMPSFIDFLNEHDVNQLALNRLAPVGRALEGYPVYAPTDAQYVHCLRDSYMAMVTSGFVVKVKPILDWARKIVNPLSQSHGCYQCGAGWSHISVDPLGNVYACDRFSFDSDWISGNIQETPLIDILNEGKMVSCRTRTTRITECGTCKVNYVCGGSCAVTSYYLKGTIDTPGHECGNMKAFIPWLDRRLAEHPAERFAIESMMLGQLPERAFLLWSNHAEAKHIPIEARGPM